ncbi:MAG: RDD family protein [Actinomycetota bacterium]
MAAEVAEVRDRARPAEFGPRFSAWMIDAASLFALQWIVVLVLSRQLQAAGMSTVEPCTPDSPIMCEGPNSALWVILFLFVVASTFGYHAWFDGVLGASPGKRAMGLRVVRATTGEPGDGTPIGLAPGLLRSVVRQSFWLWVFLFVAASPIAIEVPGIVFFGLLGLALLTFLVGSFSSSGAALHDRAVGSAVVAEPRVGEPALHNPSTTAEAST